MARNVRAPEILHLRVTAVASLCCYANLTHQLRQMTLSTRLTGPNWEVVKATNSHVRARWYTPYLQWLDVVDLYFAPSDADTVRVCRIIYFPPYLYCKVCF